MAATTTRKSMSDFRDSIKDDYCVISSEILKRWLEDNSKQQELFITTQARLADAIEQIARSLEKQPIVEDTRTQALLEKIDLLTIAINNGNTSFNVPAVNASVTSDNELKVLADKKRDLDYKIQRSNDLSKYYMELLNLEKPFAAPKFRTKVHTNTPEFEKGIRNEQTITTVKIEVQLMQERIKQWTIKLEDLETELQSKQSSLVAPRKEAFLKTLTEDKLIKYSDRTL